MSLTQLIDELKAWIAKLEGHPAVVAETKPVPEPVAATPAPPASPAAPVQSDQDKATAAYLASKATPVVDAPIQDHTGFDFGNVPSGNPKRNTLEGGKIPPYAFTFTAPNPTKLRLALVSDEAMNMNAWESVTLVLKQNGAVVKELTHQANTGTNIITFDDMEFSGSYELDVTVAKTDLVSLQFNPG